MLGALDPILLERLGSVAKFPAEGTDGFHSSSVEVLGPGIGRTDG